MFRNTAKPITKEEILEIEHNLNVKFPLDFKSHYLNFNGGVPDNQYFYMEEYGVFLWINSFIPFKYENEKTKNWTIEKSYFNFVSKNVMPNNFIPFAADYGGNQICIDTDTKEIYIVYMDLGNPMDNPDAIRKIAPDFQNFMDNLEEEGEEEDV